VTSYSYTFTVSADAIDFNGHVNNVTYLQWMMEAATRHSQLVGMSYEQCLELGGTWVAKSHNIEYKKPAFEGEELRMETWIETMGRIASKRCYRLVRIGDAAVLCEGKTEWVFVDKKRFRPSKIPENIKNAFKYQKISTTKNSI
jgi:acyl-CoA thioester hydrolase